MRTWRVGTFSMGTALILLGITLLTGKFLNQNVIQYLNLWIPMLLIIIGCEVIFYLFFHKKENSFVRYDFISIFFVGILGVCGIAFTVAAGTGLVGEWERALHAKEITKELPSYVETLPPDVNKIVLINGDGLQFSLQRSAEKEIHVFGTYSYTVYDKEKSERFDGNDLSATKTIGQTMYLTVKPLPMEKGIFRSSGYTSITIVVPGNIEMVTNDGTIL
jgi:hypothetical protein